MVGPPCEVMVKQLVCSMIVFWKDAFSGLTVMTYVCKLSHSPNRQITFCCLSTIGQYVCRESWACKTSLFRGFRRKMLLMSNRRTDSLQSKIFLRLHFWVVSTLQHVLLNKSCKAALFNVRLTAVYFDHVVGVCSWNAQKINIDPEVNDNLLSP